MPLALAPVIKWGAVAGAGALGFGAYRGARDTTQTVAAVALIGGAAWLAYRMVK